MLKMPSPQSKKEPKSGVAYTRWKPTDDCEEEETNKLNIPFQEFREEPLSVTNNNEQTGISLVFSRSLDGRDRSAVRGHRQDLCWINVVRLLVIFILVGVGWIFGFSTRWGIHSWETMEYANTCRYEPGVALWGTEEVNFSSIRTFFEEFSNTSLDEFPRLGSESFANKIAENWRYFGLEKVGVEAVSSLAPKYMNYQPETPTEITIFDPDTRSVVESVQLDANNSAKVDYSGKGIGEGTLVYGHFGRIKDLVKLEKVKNFSESVIMMRFSPLIDVGSSIRNAKIFGAKAVILFPDPFFYKITNNKGKTDKTSWTQAVLASAKPLPGDPDSPYLPPSVSASSRIPVVSVSFKLAEKLLSNYADARGVDRLMAHGLERVLRNDSEVVYGAKVEIHTELAPTKLFNVIGTIPGRYEPTRYVLVSSHHDTWRRGVSKPGNAHATLMEVARTLGDMYRHKWRPGRSIVFASFDGEELGQLGSTSWLQKHAKELQQRAVAYINLDYRGTHPVTASPIFDDIIQFSAKSATYDGQNTSLHDIWTRFHQLPVVNVEDTEEASKAKDERSSYQVQESQSPDLIVAPSANIFQSWLGISSVEVSLDEPKFSSGVATGEAADSDALGDDVGLVDRTKELLNKRFRHSAAVARFVIVLVLKLVSTPQVPLSAAAYSKHIMADYREAADQLRRMLHVVDGNATTSSPMAFPDLERSLQKFDEAASRFHSAYDTSTPSLEFLAHHEFSDQLIELERSLLAPMSATWDFLSKDFFVLSKHVVYGPSPLNPAETRLFPRLSAALEVAAKMSEQSPNEQLLTTIRSRHPDLRDVIDREAFLISDALDSASCVLDNHLVYTYPDDSI